MTLAESMDRRSFLARGMLGAAGLAAAGIGGAGLLEGCGSSSSNATQSGPRNGVSTDTPTRGGSLNFAVEAEQSSLDPSVARFDESGVNYARSLYDPLTIIAADGSIQPYLAQAVTPNTDHTIWTITTRSGVTFHDGSTCDAPAVANSMNYIMNGELGSVTIKPLVKSVVASGPNTVTITLKQPWVPFDYYLAGGIGGQIGYVVGPSVIATPSSAQAKPVGTGPFKYVDWVPNDHLSVTKYDSYWRSGLPYLDSVTFRPIPDPDSRASSLSSGTVDIMHTDVAPIILSFKSNSSFGFIDDLDNTLGEPDMDFVLLNTSKAPFTDLRVRQAMAMAVNLNAYRSVINHDLNPISVQPFVPGSAFYAPTSYPAYDTSKAQSLIKQVQQDTGKSVSFTLGTTTSPSAVQAAQLLESMFNGVGMHVNISEFQQAELINNALAGSFQAYTWRQWGAVDPDLNYLFWSPTTANLFGTLGTNFARDTNPAVEVYLQQGRQSSDMSVRAKAYQGVAEEFAKDLPYIMADRAVWSIVATGKVQNFNNPTTPSGTKAYGMIVGTIWPTEIWLS
jgi:peptide/nickel transport system substrate-binding protein